MGPTQSILLLEFLLKLFGQFDQVVDVRDRVVELFRGQGSARPVGFLFIFRKADSEMVLDQGG